ncbi:MAG TPA: hypothetical protein VJC16_05450 [Candidatus Nanoarchaeia archaeon]|nr:hypothetical protein [Candidatus Nanoarchaeia archaeon]
MRKRGQVTVFIIIGILIVLLAAIFLFLQGRLSLFQPQLAVPQHVVPIQGYIEQCIMDSAEPAIRQMAAQGGFLTIPPEVSQNPLAHYRLIPDQQQPLVPLWFSQGRMREPSISSMERELEERIAADVQGCSLETFSEQFTITAGDPAPEVSITDNEVRITVSYPLTITSKQDNVQTQLTAFRKDIQIPLGRAFSLAKAIHDKENQDGFLELLTMEMIAGDFPDMPLDGFEITLDRRQWTLQELQDELIPLLRANFHCLVFRNTANALPEACREFSAYYLRHYFIELQNPKFRDIRTTADWSFGDGFQFTRFRVSPGSTIIKPIDLKIPLISGAFKLYHHFYDIEYPLLLVLTAGDLQFNLATMVNIRNNQPDRQFNPFLVDDQPSDAGAEEYCAEKIAPFKLQARDKESGEMLSSPISYRCAQFRCELGETASPLLQGIPQYCGSRPCEPSLEASLPFCINGMLIAENPGYLTATARISSTPESPENYALLELTPLQALDYEFRIIEFPQQAARSLRHDEIILASFIAKEITYDQSIYYPSGLAVYRNITLPAGSYSYDLDIRLIRNSTSMLLGGFKADWQTSYPLIAGRQKIILTIFAESDIQDISAFNSFWESTVIPQSQQAAYQPIVR